MIKRKNSKECEEVLKEFEQDRKQDVEPDNEVQAVHEEGAGKDQEWRKRFEEFFTFMREMKDKGDVPARRIRR